MSRENLEKMKTFEDCRLTAYRDSTGVRTIGYGETSGVRPGMTITQEEADRYLEARIEGIEGRLTELGLADLSPNRWDAIVSFTYKAGLNNLKKSVLLKKVLRNPNNKSIYQEFLRWVKGGEKTYQRLLERRQWEAKLWENEV